MIPNRIFLCVGPISCWEPDKKYIYSEWQEEPQPGVENIAYLRADKVMEILEAHKEEFRLNSCCYKGLMQEIEAL